MRYLGIEPKRPRVAIFDFTCCEGCELQLANAEGSLGPFLAAIDIVNFREVSSARSDDYEVAFIEGAITRGDEVERLQKVRKKAKLLVAFGTCACFGGVNRLRNSTTPDVANKEVYGEHHKDTGPVRAVKEVVPVDLELPGCPVRKEEVERLVQHLAFGVPYQLPVHPVCVDCKRRFTECMFDRGELCLGPVTRAGCTAPCPAGGLGCWGCRGPAVEPNYDEFFASARRKGFSDEEINERMRFFGAFEGVR